jgi:hypothetical protein
MRENDWSFGNPSLPTPQRRLFDETHADAEPSSETRLRPRRERSEIHPRNGEHALEAEFGSFATRSAPTAIGLGPDARRSPSGSVFGREKAIGA